MGCDFITHCLLFQASSHTCKCRHVCTCPFLCQESDVYFLLSLSRLTLATLGHTLLSKATVGQGAGLHRNKVQVPL